MSDSVGEGKVETQKIDPPSGETLQVRSTPVIKLKDSPNRGGVKFHLAHDFGFVPEEIIVQKVRGRNNAIIVSAVLTPEKLKEEEELRIGKRPMGQTAKEALAKISGKK